MCVGGGGGGRGGVLHPHTHARFAPPCLDITTSKAQIISAFVTSCSLVHTLIVVCFEDDASLESPA